MGALGTIFSGVMSGFYTQQEAQAEADRVAAQRAAYAASFRKTTIPATGQK